jgi:hypothetical protein
MNYEYLLLLSHPSINRGFTPLYDDTSVEVEYKSSPSPSPILLVCLF